MQWLSCACPPHTRSGAASGQCRGWDGWVVGDAQPQLYSLMPDCLLRWQLCSFLPKNQFLALLVLCVVSVLCFIIFLPWWSMSTPPVVSKRPLGSTSSAMFTCARLFHFPSLVMVTCYLTMVLVWICVNEECQHFNWSATVKCLFLCLAHISIRSFNLLNCRPSLTQYGYESFIGYISCQCGVCIFTLLMVLLKNRNC